MKGFFGKISEKFKEKVNTIVMSNNTTSSVSNEIPNKNKDSQTKISNNTNSSHFNQEKKEKVLSEDESKKLKSLISIEDEDDNQVYNFVNEKNEEEEEEEEIEEEEKEEENKKDLIDKIKNSEMSDFTSFPIDKESKQTKSIINSKQDISEIENFQRTSSNFIISRLYEIGERVNLKDIEYRFICEMKKQKGGVMSLLTFIKKEEDIYEEYIIEIDNQFLYLIKNEEESNTNPNEEGKHDNKSENYKEELIFIRKISLRLNLSQLYKVNIKRKENSKDDKHVLLLTFKYHSIKEEYINDNYQYVEIVLYKNEADDLLLELRKVGVEYKFKFDIIGL